MICGLRRRGGYRDHCDRDAKGWRANQKQNQRTGAQASGDPERNEEPYVAGAVTDRDGDRDDINRWASHEPSRPLAPDGFDYLWNDEAGDRPRNCRHCRMSPSLEMRSL